MEIWLSVLLKDKVMILSCRVVRVTKPRRLLWYQWFIAHRRYRLDDNSTSLPEHLGYRIKKQRGYRKYIFLFWEVQNFYSRNYTQRLHEVYPMMTRSMMFIFGKYTQWRWEVHIASIGSTYVELWQVQSPRGRVAKMIKSFAKLIKYN
jgi:hypothetical protein